MKRLYRAIIEEQIKCLDELITILMDDLDGLVAELESLIEAPTPQELLERELEELLVEHCESATFTTEGNMTIAAVMVKESSVPLIGIAKCCPTDEFEETVGDIVALKRALGLPVDPQQYGVPKTEKDCYNCKFDDLNVLQYPCNKCCELDVEDSSYWKGVR